MKRILSVLLVLCMIIGAAPMPVGAAGETSGSCGRNLTWKLEGTTLTISGEGPMYDYNMSKTPPWYRDGSQIQTVVIGAGVTSIGDESFITFNNLTSITIPNSVTSIGNRAFDRCSSLPSITIPDSVTSIGHYAFYACESLTSIKIPDGVTSIAKSTFSNCGSLTSIEIPDSVTSIGDFAFNACESITSIEIPDGVTDIGEYAFADCISLTSVVIPENLEIISLPFRNTNIEKATYPNGNSLSIIDIYRFFPDTPLYKESMEQGSANNRDGFIIQNGILTSYRGSDSEVVIPNDVIAIGHKAFSYCNKLTSIVIPDSVTYIGEWAFAKCTNLASVTIPNSVTALGDCVFFECKSLSNLNIPDSVKSIGSLAFVRTNITSIVLPSDIVHFGQYIFQECEALTSVTFPQEGKTVETLKSWSMRYFDALFTGCSSLSIQGVENIPCEEYNQQLRFIGWLNPGRFIEPQSERIVALANEIVAGLDNDYDKAYAIYKWISDNIDYDHAYSNGEKTDVAKDPEEVLDSGLTVCSGYTNLTSALLQAVDIPSSHVLGYYAPEPVIPHAWNYIFVDDHWIWVDTTQCCFDSDLYLLNFLEDHTITAMDFESDYNTPSDWAQSDVLSAICAKLVPNDLQAAYRDNITREEFCRLMVALVEKSMGMDIDSYLKSRNLKITNPLKILITIPL